MRLPAWMRRRRVASGLAITGLSLATLAMTKAAEQNNWLGTAEPSNEPEEQPAPEPPRAYTPPSISIANDDDPATNWSKAKVFSERGEYVLEIHFDAYRPHGFGSGLIPVLANVRELNLVDESLAQAFGRYPRLFRGGLGGPRRGIGILEIAMLEPPLETKLRDPSSREHTVNCLAERVVNALVQGVS